MCSGLALGEIGGLARIVQEIEFAPHQAVVHEGDDAKSVFVIRSGVACVSKLLSDGRRQITGFLYPADFFGLSMYGHYATSVTAITDLTLCRCGRGQFEALLDRYHELEKRLLDQASNELAVAQDQMVLLGQKTAREKVASFLLTISKRARRQGLPGNPVWLPMTREEIGDYLGLTTETVSRMFSQLQELGAISKLPDGWIDLTDHQALQVLADGA